MKNSDLIMMSIRSLWRRKLRTFLTVLGVVIGSCSIILMISLGIAMSRNFEEQVASMGSLTTIEVMAKDSGDPKAPKLDDATVEKISGFENVTRVVPTLSTRANLELGKYNTPWGMDIKGMDLEDMAALDYTVAVGRNMEATDHNVIILGSQIPTEFVKKGQKPNWNKQPEPIEIKYEKDKVTINIEEKDNRGKPVETKDGKKIKAPKPYVFTVIGILPENNYETAYSAYIPKEVFELLKKDIDKYQLALYGKNNPNNQYRSKSKSKYESLKVKIGDRKKVKEVQDKIKEMGFDAYSPADYLEEMEKISQGNQVILGGIGAISLFVAAIGIANTMMMSIYERTKEIGVMKVIGAKLNDIKKMFLVEALAIGALGGLVGVIVSYLLSFFMNHFGAELLGNFMGLGMMGSSGGKISVIPVWLAIVALVFSTVIGLISGYFPAKRAMKLSALNAIKTE
ncbi:MAG: ABC transporter permease [Cellulosilyticaceae bacterium]